MDFGPDKCAVAHIKKGRITTSHFFSDIPTMTKENNYHYLGTLECTDILQTKVKEGNKSEYFTHIRSMLKTGISSKNAVSAISIFTTSTLQYFFGIICWTKSELRGLDHQIRKIIAKLGYHHLTSNTNQLYISTSRGGRGILNVVGCHPQECTALVNYINENNTDPLVSIVSDAESRTKRGLLSLVNDKSKQDFKKLIDKNHQKIFLAIPLHGQFFREQEALPNVDIDSSRG